MSLFPFSFYLVPSVRVFSASLPFPRPPSHRFRRLHRLGIACLGPQWYHEFSKPHTIWLTTTLKCKHDMKTNKPAYEHILTLWSKLCIPVVVYLCVVSFLLQTWHKKTSMRLSVYLSEHPQGPQRKHRCCYIIHDSQIRCLNIYDLQGFLGCAVPREISIIAECLWLTNLLSKLTTITNLLLVVVWLTKFFPSNLCHIPGSSRHAVEYYGSTLQPCPTPFARVSFLYALYFI